MTELLLHSGERTIPEAWKHTKEGYLLLLRLQYAYEHALSVIPPHSSILEIGCGDGYGTKMLSQHAKHIIALDVDEPAVIDAQKKYGSKNCEFMLYDGKRLPYPDNHFDAVVSMQVIEHIQDDHAFVSEIQRVLKKGGLALLTTPNKRLRLKEGQKPFNPFHVREYYAHELQAVLHSIFKDVTLLGIRGNDEIQRLEISRLQKPGLNRIINLKKLVPDSLKPVIIRTIRALKRTKASNRNFLERYSTKDYHATQNDIESSLDLLGICRK